MASPFSGKAGRNAGIWAADAAGKFYDVQAGLLAEGQKNALDALGAGRTSALDALGAGEAGALAALRSGRTDALGALDTGEAKVLDALKSGETRGLAALNSGYDRAAPQYQAAIDKFDPWYNSGKKALGTYEDSLGLNGQTGYDNTVAAFREGPGYRWAVDQATDAVARKASSLGALGSGNTMAAISDRAGHMADQEFGRWQGQVKGLSDQGLQAAGSQAGLMKGLGDLGSQIGRDQASLIGSMAGQQASQLGSFAGQRSGTLSNAAGQEASLIGNMANQRAGIYGNTGQQEAGTYTNFANLGNNNVQNLSNTVIGAGTGAMMAGQQAAQNRLNLGMQGLQLGASLLGGGLGGGIGGLFGPSGAVSNGLGAAFNFNPFGGY